MGARVPGYSRSLSIIPLRDRMDLDEALKLAYDGRALLFLGAGFSRGATNLAGNDFSLGTDLAGILSSEAGLPAGLALDDAAELYADQFGVAKLIDELD